MDSTTPLPLVAAERLISVVQDLSFARDLDTVMRIVRHAARALTGADGATFVLREGDLCYYADENAIAPLWKGQRFPMQACISGWAMLNKQPAVIEDIYQDPRIPVDAYRPTFVKSLVMVPIRRGAPIGAIGNYWARGHAATAEEVRVLQALADSTSIALENVQVYAELEERVRARTVELQALNKELDAFSFSISHDLRAPLRHIDGFAELLLKHAGSGLDDSAKRYVQHISASAKQLSQLVDDLLNFSRTGRAEMQPTAVPLKELVHEVIGSLKPDTHGRRIVWQVAQLPTIYADRPMLRQVFVNLLGNAVKYTRGREEVQISVGCADGSPSKVTIFVKDNGVGFDMQYAPKLFGVFQRLHSANEFEGTGIGLANVQRIIHRHGGQVWAEGTVNQGATFYFSIPTGRIPPHTVTGSGR